MHSLQSAAVQYTNYGTGGAFELPTQSGTYICYTTDIVVFEIYTKRYTHLGKGAIVQGEPQYL